VKYIADFIEYLLKSQIVFLLGKDQIFNDSQISQLLSKKWAFNLCTV